MTDTVRHLRIHGQVQGVGYRWAMVQIAQHLGVRGWVRNRRDGSVEAMIAGAPQPVQQVTDWARRGPSAAIVTRLEVSEGAGEFTAFEQWPTV